MRGRKAATGQPGRPQEPERLPGPDQCGHLVTGRPDLCPCRRMVDGAEGRVEGTDEQLMAGRAKAGLSEREARAAVRGIRNAEDNARRLAQEAR